MSTKHIIFTDDATFFSNDVVNSQIRRWWADENLEFVMECKTQYSFKILVWCGILCNKVIGPYLFRENLISECYLDFHRREMTVVLDNMSLEK